MSNMSPSTAIEVFEVFAPDMHVPQYRPFIFSKGNAKTMISRRTKIFHKEKQPLFPLCLPLVPVCGQNQNQGIFGVVCKENFLFVCKVKQDQLFPNLPHFSKER